MAALQIPLCNPDLPLLRQQRPKSNASSVTYTTFPVLTQKVTFLPQAVSAATEIIIKPCATFGLSH